MMAMPISPPPPDGPPHPRKTFYCAEEEIEELWENLQWDLPRLNFLYDLFEALFKTHNINSSASSSSSSSGQSSSSSTSSSFLDLSSLSIPPQNASNEISQEGGERIVAAASSGPKVMPKRLCGFVVQKLLFTLGLWHSLEYNNICRVFTNKDDMNVLEFSLLFALVDADTPHAVGLQCGKLRLRLIFHFYDREDKGYWNASEWTAFVNDLLQDPRIKASGGSSAPKTIELALELLQEKQSSKTSVVTATSLKSHEFSSLVDQQIVRGTSKMFRVFVFHPNTYRPIKSLNELVASSSLFSFSPSRTIPTSSCVLIPPPPPSYNMVRFPSSGRLDLSSLPPFSHRTCSSIPPPYSMTIESRPCMDTSSSPCVPRYSKISSLSNSSFSVALPPLIPPPHSPKFSLKSVPSTFSSPHYLKTTEATGAAASKPFTNKIDDLNYSNHPTTTSIISNYPRSMYPISQSRLDNCTLYTNTSPISFPSSSYSSSCAISASASLPFISDSSVRPFSHHHTPRGTLHLSFNQAQQLSGGVRNLLSSSAKFGHDSFPHSPYIRSEQLLENSKNFSNAFPLQASSFSDVSTTNQHRPPRLPNCPTDTAQLSGTRLMNLDGSISFLTRRSREKNQSGNNKGGIEFHHNNKTSTPLLSSSVRFPGQRHHHQNLSTSSSSGILPSVPEGGRLLGELQYEAKFKSFFDKIQLSEVTDVSKLPVITQQWFEGLSPSSCISSLGTTTRWPTSITTNVAAGGELSSFVSSSYVKNATSSLMRHEAAVVPSKFPEEREEGGLSSSSFSSSFSSLSSSVDAQCSSQSTPETSSHISSQSLCLSGHAIRPAVGGRRCGSNVLNELDEVKAEEEADASAVFHTSSSSSDIEEGRKEENVESKIIVSSSSGGSLSSRSIPVLQLSSLSEHFAACAEGEDGNEDNGNTTVLLSRIPAPMQSAECCAIPSGSLLTYPSTKQNEETSFTSSFTIKSAFEKIFNNNETPTMVRRVSQPQQRRSSLSSQILPFPLPTHRKQSMNTAETLNDNNTHDSFGVLQESSPSGWATPGPLTLRSTAVVRPHPDATLVKEESNALVLSQRLLKGLSSSNGTGGGRKGGRGERSSFVSKSNNNKNGNGKKDRKDVALNPHRFRLMFFLEREYGVTSRSENPLYLLPMRFVNLCKSLDNRINEDIESGEEEEGESDEEENGKRKNDSDGNKRWKTLILKRFRSLIDGVLSEAHKEAMNSSTEMREILSGFDGLDVLLFYYHMRLSDGIEDMSGSPSTIRELSKRVVRISEVAAANNENESATATASVSAVASTRSVLTLLETSDDVGDEKEKEEESIRFSPTLRRPQQLPDRSLSHLQDLLQLEFQQHPHHRSKTLLSSSSPPPRGSSSSFLNSESFALSPMLYQSSRQASPCPRPFLLSADDGELVVGVPHSPHPKLQVCEEPPHRIEVDQLAQSSAPLHPPCFPRRKLHSSTHSEMLCERFGSVGAASTSFQKKIFAELSDAVPCSRFPIRVCLGETNDGAGAVPNATLPSIQSGVSVSDSQNQSRLEDSISSTARAASRRRQGGGGDFVAATAAAVGKDCLKMDVVVRDVEVPHQHHLNSGVTEISSSSSSSNSSAMMNCNFFLDRYETASTASTPQKSTGNRRASVASVASTDDELHVLKLMDHSPLDPLPRRRFHYLQNKCQIPLPPSTSKDSSGACPYDIPSQNTEEEEKYEKEDHQCDVLEIKENTKEVDNNDDKMLSLFSNSNDNYCLRGNIDDDDDEMSSSWQQQQQQQPLDTFLHLSYNNNKLQKMDDAVGDDAKDILTDAHIEDQSCSSNLANVEVLTERVFSPPVSPFCRVRRGSSSSEVGKGEGREKGKVMDNRKVSINEDEEYDDIETVPYSSISDCLDDKINNNSSSSVPPSPGNPQVIPLTLFNYDNLASVVVVE